jgi:hypothetical protein
MAFDGADLHAGRKLEIERARDDEVSGLARIDACHQQRK